MSDFPAACAVAWGEDRCGLWQTIALNGVEQRLRWIEAGDFWMGSPEDEPERRDDEQRHPVTLSRGYWLADTACTQALWAAVMGENPSRFSDDPQNPVERVSWEDVQGFIERANAQLEGLQLRLPTEAEWEYACRAGAQSAFWWGDTLPPERANYFGNYPYNGGPKDADRDTTVPVKTFDPNPRGLYQMHGNVWEWCADLYGDYGAAAVQDPEGPATGQRRVCRGGCWSSSGRYLRAALRYRNAPVVRFHSLGFRLAGG